MEEQRRIEERLRAYIHPNEAETEEERSAFDAAVRAQLAFERDGAEVLPSGVAALSIGDYSLTLAEPAGAAYTQANLCPAAWAILFNAGLLRRAWPTAKRL